MERRTKVQPEDVLIARLQTCLPRQSANLRGRAVVHLKNSGVESTHAAKARRDCDLVHRQLRLVDQLLGKVQAACLCYRNWRGAEMPHEQPPQVTRADAESLRE